MVAFFQDNLFELLNTKDDPPIFTSDFELQSPSKRQRKLVKPAAVLILIFRPSLEPMVVFTKRSPNLQYHPGQISFPGGKVEKNDPGEVDAALRESVEEIGIKPEKTKILGRLPSHYTVTGFRISPFVGITNSVEKHIHQH